MAAAGESEHQEHVGLIAHKQQWQLAIDGLVAGVKDVRGASCAGEFSAARQFFHESARGIERRARKRTESGEEDVHR
jgi:hypothetical protein